MVVSNNYAQREANINFPSTTAIMGTLGLGATL